MKRRIDVIDRLRPYRVRDVCPFCHRPGGASRVWPDVEHVAAVGHRWCVADFHHDLDK